MGKASGSVRDERTGPGRTRAPSRLVAAAYDWLIAPLERLWLARRRADLVGPARGHVLEVGVGTGLTLPYYREAIDVVGVDPNPAMLERARLRAKEARVPVAFDTAPAEALPFEPGRFDTAVASLVLCTVDDPLATARELRRALRPGGQLRFLEHVRAPGRRLGRLQDLVTPLWRRAFGNCHPNRDTLGVLTEAGFDIEQVRRHLRGVVVAGTARARPDEVNPGTGGVPTGKEQP